MIQSLLVRLVGASARFRWLVAAAYLVVGTAAAIHSVRDFRITTDTERLMPATLSWRRHQIRFEQLFPPDRMVAVVDARTPEAADRAASALALALFRQAADRDSPIRGAALRGFGPFFEREALMLAPPSATTGLARRLEASRPLLGIVSADPTLRGFARAAGAAAEGAAAGRLPPGALGSLLANAAAAIDDPAAHPFSPERALGAADHGSGATRRLIAVDPALDYRALRPGARATAALRANWNALDPAARDGATLAITGEVPVNDEQFGAVQHGQTVGLLLTTVAVVAIFFLALRSVRIMAAVALSLGCGFAITCSVAILTVGSFNLLSIAFAILFVGLGADFGIQFSIRYRNERFRAGLRGIEGGSTPSRDRMLRAVLAAAADRAGTPLALAAASTTVGFFCFLPTAYRGVSELGLIAGVGMLIAFATTMTLLPALLAILHPPGEAQAMGFRFLAPVDRVLGRHRIAVIATTFGVVAVLSPALLAVRFDFDPTHMQIPSGEAVSAFNRLRAEQPSAVEGLDVAAPDLAAADRLAARLRRLPEVAEARTASALVTDDPAAHEAALRPLRALIAPVLGTGAANATAPAADDASTVAALGRAAAALRRAASGGSTGASAARSAPPAPDGTAALGRAFAALASGTAAQRRTAAAAIVPPLAADLDRLRLMLDGTPTTIANLPPSVRRDWIAPNGAARVSALPRGDARRNATVARFARAVTAIAPDASGNPATLLGWRRTVVRAFAEAAALAIVAIALVLLGVLRRLRDVGLTLLPLLVAGVVTLEIATVLGMSLNFANIVALPLLLGVGVAFKIYYVMAWREGVTDLLQSTLTRAVLFSAATTGVAFGSLWLSPQPGTASMGALMALALGCTLCAAVLFQPALMGRPPGKPTGNASGAATRV